MSELLQTSGMDRTQVPRIEKHFRFQWEPAQDCYVLLYPEGMIKMNGSAGEILAVCDGERSIDDIIDLLQTKFPDAGDLADDILEFLTVAHEKRWIAVN
ncbi:coenzyme PQQ synthesis protein D [Luminiphilus syltensis NOR5-1B]|uniref:PqqA binding protein n=1 Tax=Luminiphilus syltensis NOR5-1B TaxID=565045 RepID=B8KVB4_9GAMM|nr:pyrroloquinoline quinone biosynthesis peptide chaperone PqqD [Luminiphilus syltensis]EED36788.1 coenzyme PQQ synthesis protein D [Luminiphilus syltensis NOR5-1B]